MSRLVLPFSLPRIFLMPVAVSALMLPAVVAADDFPFRDPDLPMERRIDDLIGRLTLEEKIDCMAMSASVPRL
jgi:beta-glucosidase